MTVIRKIQYVILKSWSDRLLAKLILLATQIYIIPTIILTYGSESFGEFATVVALSSIMNLFDFGITKSTMLSLTKMNDKELIKQKISDGFIAIIFVISTIAAMFVFIGGWLETKVNVNSNFLVPFVIYVSSSLLLNYFYDCMRGVGRHRHAARFFLANSVLTSILSLTLIGQVESTALLYALCYTGPSVFMAIIITLSMWDVSKFRLSRSVANIINKANVGFSLLSIIQFLSFSVDILYINIILGSVDAGIYSIVLRITNIILFINSALMINMTSILSTHGSNQTMTKAINKQLYNYVLLYIVFLCLFFYFVGPLAVSYLNRTEEIVPNYFIYLMGVQAAVVVVSSRIIVNLNAKIILFPQVLFLGAALVTNVALMVKYLPVYGIIAAPITTIITYGLIGIFPLWFFYVRNKF